MYLLYFLKSRNEGLMIYFLFILFFVTGAVMAKQKGAVYILAVLIFCTDLTARLENDRL